MNYLEKVKGEAFSFGRPQVIRVGFNFFLIGKEIMIRNILKTFNIEYVILAYEITSFNPIGSIVNLLAVKFGISKIVVMIILAFLL